MKKINIKIIGLGGIGTYLCDPLFRFLNAQNNILTDATLIDGDIIESKNFDRQVLRGSGYKSEKKKNDLERLFSNNISFNSIPEYLNVDNISKYINDYDYVFMCVDNHKTRKIVSDYVETLDNISLISGGNDYTDGNVQIFIKEDGKKILPSITDYHPEIVNYNDKSPEEMSCEELQNSEPQLIFTNLFASTIMVSCFYNLFIYNSTNNISEIYFDIIQLSALSKVRELKK